MTSTFDYQQAKESGYSDTEIINYLRDQNPEFDVVGASETGYSSEEIMKHLSESKKPEAYITPYDVDLPEDTKTLSVRERMQLAQDLKTEREFRTSKGETKNLLAGLSFGASKNIEALRPEEGDYGSIVGTILGEAPLMLTAHGLISKAVLAGVSKLPMGPGAIRAISSLISAGTTGATLETAKEIADPDKELSLQDIALHGAEWVALDGALQAFDMGSLFAKALWRNSKRTNRSPVDLANDFLSSIEKEGLDITEISKESLDQRIKSMDKDFADVTKKPDTVEVKPVTGKDVTRFETPPTEPVRPEIEPTPEIPVVKPEIPKEKFTEKELDNFGKDLKTKQELGRDVKSNIIKNRANAREQYVVEDGELVAKGYKPAYEKAYAGKEQDLVPTIDPAHTVMTAIKKIESIATKPSGYKPAVKELVNVLEDVGFPLKKDDSGRLIKDEAGNYQLAEDIPASATLKNLGELNTRLGEMAAFDELEPSIKQVFSDAKKDVKTAIKTHLESTDKEAYEAFLSADEQFKDAAEKFGNDNIIKIRKLRNVEDIPSSLKPTILDDIKNTVSPEIYQEIERRLLSDINKMSLEKAEEELFELGNQLSPIAKKYAQQIIKAKESAKKAKDKPEKAVRTVPEIIKDDIKELEDKIIKDVRGAKKPKGLITTWEDKLGRKKIRQALKNNPNKDEIISYLQEEATFDIFGKMEKPDGTIDYKAVNKFMRTTKGKDFVQDIGGMDAVRFMRELERNVKSMQETFKRLDQIQEREGPLKGARKYKGSKKVTPDMSEKEVQAWSDHKIDQMKSAIQRKKDKAEPIKESLKKFWNDLSPATKGGLLAAGAVASGIKFGFTAAGIGGLGTYAAKKVATKYVSKTIFDFINERSIRDAFRQMAKGKSDPMKLILGVQALDRAIEEDEKQQEKRKKERRKKR